MRQPPEGGHLLLGVVDDRRDDVIELVTHGGVDDAPGPRDCFFILEPLAVPPDRAGTMDRPS